MKKSELSFKCVLPKPSSISKITDLLDKKGIGEKSIIAHAKTTAGKNAVFASISLKDGFTVGLCSRADYFCSWSEPLMSYEESLRLIESVEPDAPKFDIKPFDRILVRGANGSEWLARLYEAKGICSFMETGGRFCNQLIKYDGNEHLHRTVNPAAGWWECENGKPAWKTK